MVPWHLWKSVVGCACVIPICHILEILILEADTRQRPVLSAILTLAVSMAYNRATPCHKESWTTKPMRGYQVICLTSLLGDTVYTDLYSYAMVQPSMVYNKEQLFKTNIFGCDWIMWITFQFKHILTGFMFV